MQETSARAIAHAVCDAGARVVTNVPGFGGTEVFEALCQIECKSYPVSFHEEVAYTIAHGASLVGQRSATMMKAHGLAKAANSVVDSLSSGTTAGFIVVVFEDRLGKHSDSIFDVAALVRGLGIPYRALSSKNMYRGVFDAFDWSESLRIPVALLVNADDLDKDQTYDRAQRTTISTGYQRDVGQHVVCPLLAEYQRLVLDAKLGGRDWRKIRKPYLPTVPETLPEVYQSTARSYMPLFAIFKKLRSRFVAGDTGTSGVFAFPPYDCIDVLTYMGGSIPLAIGAYLAGYHDTWAVTGDFSFIAAGHLGLLEAVQREIPMKVLIFDDGKAQATGGQPITVEMLERVLSGYQPYLRRIRNPQDMDEVESVLREARNAEEMRIVVADYRSGH